MDHRPGLGSVALLEFPRGLDMGRGGRGVAVQRSLADALAVDQFLVQRAGTHSGDGLAHKSQNVFVVKEPSQHAFLEASGHSGPVPADGLEADDFQATVLGVAHPTRVPLFAAPLASADPGQEETREDLFEFEIEPGLHVVFRPDTLSDFLGHALAQPFGYFHALRAASLVGQLDENRIGVAIEHFDASGLKALARPRQGLLAKAGDGIGEFGAEESAGGCGEDSEHGVHHDFDRLIGVAIPALLGGLTSLHEPFEDSRKDRLPARETGPIGRHDGGPGHFLASPGQGQGVDIEGPHEAGVEALEIVDGDISRQAGHGFEDAAAGDGRRVLLGIHIRGHRAMTSQFGQIDQVEGGDAGSHPVQLHPGQAAALARQGQQVLVFQDFHHQSRILAVVGHQGLGVFPVEAGDLRRGVGRFFVDQLPPAQDGVGHGSQAVIGQA